MATTPTATRCFDALHSHAALAERNRRSRARLDTVREALNESAIVRDNPLAIFCAGSLARMESGRKSDLDLFVTAEADDHGEFRKRLFQITLFSELIPRASPYDSGTLLPRSECSESVQTVPHPVSWTHVCATRHGVARIPRALRVACDTPASRGASTGCSVRRTRRRPRARRRDVERPGRRRLAP